MCEQELLQRMIVLAINNHMASPITTIKNMSYLTKTRVYGLIERCHCNKITNSHIMAVNTLNLTIYINLTIYRCHAAMHTLDTPHDTRLSILQGCTRSTSYRQDIHKITRCYTFTPQPNGLRSVMLKHITILSTLRELLKRTNN